MQPLGSVLAKHGRRFGILAATLGVGIAGTLVVQHVRAAGIPAESTLSYSGHLAAPDGTPVSGPKNIGLGVYNAATGGARVCDVVSSQVIVTAGRFQIALPDLCVSAIKANSDLWVEVQVDGASIGRTKMGAAPYAIEAAEASAATGLLAQQIVPAGAVMAFDLAACPAGWTELEAARGRVLVGVATGLTRGTAVGANSVKLTTNQIPAHAHTGTTGYGNAMQYRVVATIGLSHANNHVNGWTGTADFGDYNDDDWPMSAHTHSFTTSEVGAGQAFDNRQESLPLLYCKKN
ncbi:MAG TPA: hypothetical protein VKP30_14195 [Polyangiaceae bacterium]|nr:hypothetical protein [Polyangiaceae bacterium]